MTGRDETALLPDRSPAVERSPVPPRRVRPTTSRRPTRPAVRSQPGPPHVWFGVAWAAVTLAAILEGTVWLALWLATAAGLAAASGIHSWAAAPGADDEARRGRVPELQPPVVLAALAAAAITMSSAIGPMAATAVGGAVLLCLIAAALLRPGGRPALGVRVLIVLGPAAAASGLTLARAQGLPQGLVLAGLVTVYDASSFLIGTGASNRWEGPIAGLASMGALILFTAAVLSPPFRGASPWILGGAAAMLAPAGPVLARWLVGDPSARVPALRRLDSLLLLGPAWAAGVAVLVHS